MPNFLGKSMPSLDIWGIVMFSFFLLDLSNAFDLYPYGVYWIFFKSVFRNICLSRHDLSLKEKIVLS